MSHTPDLYPPNLHWRQVMLRLLVVNEVLVVVGALSMHATETLDTKLTQVMGLPYYFVWMHCIGLFGLIVNGTTMLTMARQAWRRLPDAAERHAHQGVYQALPVSARWQLVGASVLAIAVSATLAQTAFTGLLASPLGAWLPQATPSFGVTFFDTFYGTLVIYVFEYFHDRNTLSRTREQMARKLSAQAQLDMLRSQLDPHMLFNTLSNLYELIDENPAQARSMLAHLIDFLRSTLSGSRASVHGLAEEFRLTSDYLSLMHFRMGDRLQAQLTLPEGLRDARVPAMLLQPLVENAIKHGLEPRKDGGTLQVIAEMQGSDLVLQVSNSGTTDQVTADPPALTWPTGSGFGLHCVRDRLSALYGEDASVTLRHLPAQDLTRVTLRLPLMTSDITPTS